MRTPVPDHRALAEIIGEDGRRRPHRDPRRNPPPQPRRTERKHRPRGPAGPQVDEVDEMRGAGHDDPSEHLVQGPPLEERAGHQPGPADPDQLDRPAGDFTAAQGGEVRAEPAPVVTAEVVVRPAQRTRPDREEPGRPGPRGGQGRAPGQRAERDGGPGVQVDGVRPA
ncbi:hypothetical protein [Streptomyces hundungensis]|uniref:hypothetical protein n=1 Tax=Streptomyces hundungensis TaxID=1077946 RepID=UPI003F54ADB1